MKQVAIKLTSAIGIGGILYRAGSVIEVSDEAAKDLLRRGKGELATAADEEEYEEGGDDFPDLSKMSKAKLLEIAASGGLTDITDANTKAEIIAAIEAAVQERAKAQAE
jgi:hypothetical protein